MQTSSLLVRKRIATLFFIFTLAFLLLGGRLFWVQFVRGAELSELASQNRMRDVPVESKRGIIYDRNGKELSISISSDSIYAIPAEIKRSKKEKEIASQLATILDMDEENLLEKITKNSSFEWVKRQIDPEKAQAIRDLSLAGIGLTEESRRHYPKGSLASHILGISGLDNTGLEGIDFYYNDLVGGTKGRIVIEHDAVGREIPEAVHRYIAPEDGSNLVLTIDETIQYITERELDKAFRERSAKSATAIVMDTDTGEILALATRPNFDPNNFSAFPDQNRRNFAINDAFEPGSTMKIITAAMLLEEGVVNPETKFFCPGYIKVGRESIACANDKAHGDQTFKEVVENSCNVGFVKTGLELGLDKYFSYLYAFGFGKPTGIDLPGEASGILVPKGSAKQIDLGTMSMGQANAVTVIQLISAVSAVANGGKLMHPHILKEVIDSEGNIIKKVEPKIVKQVISQETAKELSLILEGVVSDGTGSNAYVEGYRIAGKTGTAQKIAPGGGYLANEYIASFVGFAPANKPRLSCIVIIDAPQGYPYYGGWVAAPVLREILRDSLRYLEIPIDEIPTEENQVDNRVIVPDIVNLPLNEAIYLIKARGLDPRTNGEGNIVWQQLPRANSRVIPNTQINIYLSPFDAENQFGEVTVPDLEGKSMREVAAILSDLGLHLVPEGFGISYKQIPEAGKMLTKGSNIRVYFQAMGSESQSD